MTARSTPKTWVVNDAHFVEDTIGQRQLVVGLSTKEWIAISGDEDRPGDATTFVWIVLNKNDQLVEIGFRPHTHVTEQECLDHVRLLLAIVRPFGADEDPKRLLGRTLPQRGP